MNEDRVFGFWFAFCALMSVAWIAVCIWAIIALVGWVTTK